jgi:hypothetical protein
LDGARRQSGRHGVDPGCGRKVGGRPTGQSDAATGFALFAFREVGGERHALAANDPALTADIPPADVAEVTVMAALGKPMIMYMRWR